MEYQPALFSSLSVAPIRKEPEVSKVDFDGLRKYAFLYTATETGKSSGIRFAMEIEDAMRWCQSELSKGVMFGANWAYFWTSVATFVGSAWGNNQNPELDITRMKDNGQWDGVISGLCLKKISIHEFRSVFSPYGLVVIDKKRVDDV